METTRFSLLLRIKDLDNSQAWSEFDSIYRPMLRRFARARGLNDNDTEDLVQHCMLAIHKHIQGFEYDPKKGRFKGWLRTMVGNRVRNFFRDNRFERNAESQDFKRADQAAESPDDTFERLWMEEHLRHCLEQVRLEVDEITFKAFQRYAIDEESVDAVCQEVGVTAAQLYKIKWKVTQKLSEKMKEIVGDDE